MMDTFQDLDAPDGADDAYRMKLREHNAFVRALTETVDRLQGKLDGAHGNAVERNTFDELLLDVGIEKAEEEKPGGGGVVTPSSAEEGGMTTAEQVEESDAYNTSTKKMTYAHKTFVFENGHLKNVVERIPDELVTTATTECPEE